MIDALERGGLILDAHHVAAVKEGLKQIRRERYLEHKRTPRNASAEDVQRERGKNPLGLM